jgi:N-glycosylase/DNA lyase
MKLCFKRVGEDLSLVVNFLMKILNAQRESETFVFIICLLLIEKIYDDFIDRVSGSVTILK